MSRSKPTVRPRSSPSARLRRVAGVRFRARVFTRRPPVALRPLAFGLLRFAARFLMATLL
jgi:hypothetical protein